MHNKHILFVVSIILEKLINLSMSTIIYFTLLFSYLRIDDCKHTHTHARASKICRASIIYDHFVKKKSKSFLLA